MKHTLVKSLYQLLKFWRTPIFCVIIICNSTVAFAQNPYNPLAENVEMLQKLEHELGLLVNTINEGVDYTQMLYLRPIPTIMSDQLNMITYGESMMNLAGEDQKDRAMGMLAAMYCILQNRIITDQSSHEYASKNFDIPVSRVCAEKIRKVQDQITNNVVRPRLSKMSEESLVARKIIALYLEGFSLEAP